MQPQQPYQSPMQPAPVKKKVTARSIIFTLMVVFGVVLLIGAAAWIYLLTKQSSDNGKTPSGAALLLEPTDKAPKLVEVKSELGMNLTYNSRELAAFGFADDITYSSSDITETRPYSVLRVRPVETSQATRSEVALASPELRITSSLSEAYWAELSNEKGYEELSKIDQLVKQTIDQRKTNKNVEASDASVAEIAGTDYRKVSFTYKNEDLGVTTTQREDCYMTVAHDRPHVACINNIRSSNFSVVPQLEQVLSTLRYDAVADDVLISEKNDATKADEKMLDSKTDEDISEQIRDSEMGDEEAGKNVDSAASDYLKKSEDFSAFLKSAPATVRVGVIYCADIKLTLPNGSNGPQLTGACVDKGGTGFFISNEGIISTSASVVQVRPQDAIRSYIVDAPNTDQMYDRLDRVLDYLIESRILMESDAVAIKAGVQERNQDVIDKVANLADLISLENITIARESYDYALQLSDKPIVVSDQGDGSRTFAYSDAVIEAELIAKDYSVDTTQQEIQNGKAVAEDTALLKVKKEGSYPTLKFADSSNVGSETSVGIVGSPLYAVGSLESAQLHSTLMFRQGKAGEVFNGANSQRLLSIGTPSHAGLTGAPAVNTAAQVIGVATYGNLNCPENKCFAGTVLRDTVDVIALVRDRNLTLQPLSPIRENWNRAVDELLRGNYEKSSELFNRAAALYPQNYLATPYANFAKAQIGSARDTSSYNVWLGVAQIAVVTSAILLVILLVARLALKLFTKPRIETQYGQLAGGQQIDPRQWQQQATSSEPVAIPPQQAWQPSYQNTQQQYPYNSPPPANTQSNQYPQQVSQPTPPPSYTQSPRQLDSPPSQPPTNQRRS